MKKIMFNDKYGLTAAVLNGKKTMTRRAVPSKLLQKYGHNKFNDRSKDLIFDAPFRLGEIVAVAQSYESMANGGYLDRMTVPADNAVGFEFKLEYCGGGYKNKMFVAADLMPHHIRITDIKVERLQAISDEDCLKEGIEEDHPCYWVATDYDNPDFRKISDELADHLPNRNGKMESYYWDSPLKCFAHLIEKVSGKGTWESNPWVFAYTFELID